MITLPQTKNITQPLIIKQFTTRVQNHKSKPKTSVKHVFEQDKQLENILKKQRKSEVYGQRKTKKSIFSSLKKKYSSRLQNRKYKTQKTKLLFKISTQHLKNNKKFLLTQEMPKNISTVLVFVVINEIHFKV